jgi:two-component sensor histidine kinase
VRNSLATVLSLAQQTARSADSVASFNQAFQARVMALAGAHSLLTKQNWEGASLRGIVEATLAPHGDANSGRVRAAGPDCDLSAAQALAMSLGLHELATNARKYGALSTEAGTVSIEWSISDDPKSPELLLRWSEKGGPPVHPPTRRGFGTRLLTTALGSDLGGSVSIDFAPGGVSCSMRFPLGAEAPARPSLAESSVAN